MKANSIFKRVLMLCHKIEQLSRSTTAYQQSKTQTKSSSSTDKPSKGGAHMNNWLLPATSKVLLWTNSSLIIDYNKIAGVWNDKIPLNGFVFEDPTIFYFNYILITCRRAFTNLEEDSHNSSTQQSSQSTTQDQLQRELGNIFCLLTTNGFNCTRDNS